MNVNEMSDQEKSVMLALLCGWDVRNIQLDSGAWQRLLCDSDGQVLQPKILFGGGLAPKRVELKPTKSLNLYDPILMALAWRVLNFAITYEWPGQIRGYPNDGQILEWNLTEAELMRMPPAEAQRVWLDKILSLAIDAGIEATIDGGALADTAVSQDTAE